MKHIKHTDEYCPEFGICTECAVRELDNNSRPLDQYFRRHLIERPEIYEKLVDLAKEAYSVGWRSIGIGLLWEQMRWKHGPHTPDESGFGMSNSLRSRYARLIADEYPELAGLFRFRHLSS